MLNLACLTTVGLVSSVALAAAPETPTQTQTQTPDDARARSEQHYRAGLELFEAGDREQALVEFQIAHELYHSNDTVFIMAQCEYHLGRLKDARDHYQQYLREQPQGTLAETARLRIAAIDRRPSKFVINSVPDDVQVTLEGAGQNLVGEAPNEFEVAHGRYRIKVSRPRYQSETREIEIGIAETKSLFFGLKPVPARLRIRTVPRKATLFVRGMQAENPYEQDIEPGDYQIYAEARNYAPRRDTIRVEPGEVRDLEFGLQYVQRSGKPELVGFWTVMGAVVGGGAVLSVLEPKLDGPNPASGSLITVAAGAGALSGLLLANAFTPDYIQDNLAIQRMGFMWVGTAEGILTGLTIHSTTGAGWIGGGVGLVAGAAAGALLDDAAPDYGRGVTIQSAALVGALSGALMVPALDLGKNHTDVAMLIGLNAGLAGGLALSYFSDRSERGPSWQRVLLIDLGGLAGAFAGAATSALMKCLDSGASSNCSFDDRQTTARFALAGGAIGLVAGWVLTTGILPKLPETRSIDVKSGVGPLPVVGIDGSLDLVPGLTASGLF